MTQRLSRAEIALAINVRREAERRDWELTVSEAADILGEPLRRVRKVVKAHGWAGRFMPPPMPIAEFGYDRAGLEIMG